MGFQKKQEINETQRKEKSYTNVIMSRMLYAHKIPRLRVGGGGGGGGGGVSARKREKNGDRETKSMDNTQAPMQVG
jgi:hypothetical protein